MSNKSKIKKRRDRNTLTFYEKIAVIRHYEANQLSRNNLARMFQCCTTQIRKIIERKDEILAQWQVMCETNASAVIEEMSKKRREFEMKAVGFILHQWVERCRELQLNLIINDATLKMIAIKMATVLNIKDFKPTARWIERFRLKFKYKNSNLSNPRSLDDPQGSLSVEDIIIEFKNFLPSFMRQEISNVTSNNSNMQDSVSNTSHQEESEHVDESISEDANDENELENNSYINEVPSPGKSSEYENLSPESVLNHLSVVQQFLTLNCDNQAIAVAAHLEKHIEQKYFLSSKPTDLVADDDEYVILIE